MASEVQIRHGITGRSVCGESASVESVDHWKQEVLPTIVKHYALSDTDETGLFFNLLPSKILADKNDPCFGGKKSKQRITVLLTTNAEETSKMRPLAMQFTSVAWNAVQPTTIEKCFRKAGIALEDLGHEETTKEFWVLDSKIYISIIDIYQIYGLNEEQISRSMKFKMSSNVPPEQCPQR
ncbi:uncharacterized protein [Halyomorpha halys]|uniref:uncharacterized protein n=1 Tax=Halyomorpha halys TaxID=286706 RepID=UPI0006D4C84E